MASKPVPAPMTGKRKRDQVDETTSSSSTSSITLQIVTGSYERVLHGLQATLALPLSETSSPITFNDTFLFHAHGSCVRSLAISPASDPQTSTSNQSSPSKRILATGSTDERINLYQISSTAPTPTSSKTLQPKPLPFVTTTPSTTFSTNASTNRELGSLLHHSSTVTSLHFPSRTKLLSASSDNTLAIARTRDWTVLSTMRAPVPKTLNRPSGDTSAPGDVPAGINALAVHPSSKLGVSVGQGEKCMRLWDLVRGKKAGVLVFERKVLEAVGEARFRGGEGRSVVWGRGGEEFAVGFERGVVVFGLDCAVRGVIAVKGTKVCQIRYLPDDEEEGEDGEEREERPGVLAVSTEDGRVLFYDTNPANGITINTATSTSLAPKKGKSDSPPPQLRLLAQIGTPTRGSRVKDFEIFALPPAPSPSAAVSAAPPSKDTHYILVAGTSDGSIRLWSFKQSELQASAAASPENGDAITGTKNQVGTLLGTYETGRRITCLAGFVMEDFIGMSRMKAKKGRTAEADGGEDGAVAEDGDEDSDDDRDDDEEDEDAKESEDGEEDEFGGFD